MNNKMYKLMNWPEIEEIVYSDGNDPHRILGAHKVGTSFLVQTFRPNVKSVSVIIPGDKPKKFDMELADEAGFYVALIPYNKENAKYEYEITDQAGEVTVEKDPYNFPPYLTREDAIKLSGGVHYSIYERLGAHVVELDGVKGVLFAVWCPWVARVSVIGDFNNHDGRIHQMRMIDPVGIFELFIPDLEEGVSYQYEVKTNEGFVFIKPDPYTSCFLPGDKEASVVTKSLSYRWNDKNWMQERKLYDKKNAKLSVCELSLTDFANDNGEGLDYQSLAPLVADYITDSGFNAIELMPVMRHLSDDPYAVTGYYAVDESLGTAEQFAFFMNTMHEAGIRVIMDFPATFFSEENRSLRQYNGGALFEYGDSRGLRPGSRYVVFDYGRREVQNYLLSAALYWLDTFHLDGLRLPDISKILYLDYDRKPGEWTPNIYGGNENLEAEEFIRSLTGMAEKKDKGLLMICKETACYPQVTGALADGGLGFDYKWNNGWSRDFFAYIKEDPLFRSSQHNVLTFSMIYQYSEKFILAFSHEDIGGLRPMLDLMPGSDAQKAANARFAIAYLYLHPGRKMVFRGISDFPEEGGKKIGRLIRDMNHLYQDNPALYNMDDSPEGFRWLNSMASDLGYMTFMRIDTASDEKLLAVCNMAGLERDMIIGVPDDGKYTEVLNTDRSRYGGGGQVYGNIPLEPVHTGADGQPYSIKVKMAPLSIIVFRYETYTEEEMSIRAIRHEMHDQIQEEQLSTRELMERKREEEEEKLLLELRAKYQAELEAQEQAIAEKYHAEEERRIKNVLQTAKDALTPKKKGKTGRTPGKRK